jgi:hypothetical protein
MTDIMKGLSLWQPWASLWAVGAKDNETRSWATNYRGLIAIHASAKSIKSVLRECFPCGDWEYHPSFKAKERFLDAVEKYVDIDELHLGAIIGYGELVDCHLMTPELIGKQTPQELLFGDWRPGRFAWEIKNRVLLENPIPYKGAQGLWIVRNPEEILQRGA